MRIRSAVLAALGAGVLALTVPTTSQAATWYATEAVDYGPIRSCFLSSCDVVGASFPGQPVWWSHYAYNEPYHNKWYYVRNDNGNQGWLYCAHISAGC